MPYPDIRKNLWQLGLSMPTRGDYLELETAVIDAANPGLHKFLCNPKIPKTKSKVPMLVELVRALQLHDYYDSKTKLRMDTLYHVLQGDGLRSALEACLISSIPLEKSVTLINKRWNQTLTKEDALMYQSIFYDVSQFTVEDWAFHLSQSSPKNASLKRYVLENSDEHDQICWRASLEVDLKFTTVLRRYMTDSYFHGQEAFAKKNPDPIFLKAMVHISTQTGKELGKLTDDAPIKAQQIPIRVVEDNRKSGAVPVSARVHKGPLPALEDKSSSRPPNLAILPAKANRKGES